MVEVRGFGLAPWEECGPREEVRAARAVRLGGLGIPVVEELGFGHSATALTVPLGVPGVLDAEMCTLLWTCPP
ncbi:hypothetical protein ACFUAG_24220 [Streptomyces sp. NPDC057193]|uniref:hypothetical protein n=1 Tax=Streptomyces sp. NPDC057193 TaxID=3346043 RepID=UPI003644784F